MMLKMLQCTGQSPQQRIICPQMSTLPWWRIFIHLLIEKLHFRDHIIVLNSVSQVAHQSSFHFKMLTQPTFSTYQGGVR